MVIRIKLNSFAVFGNPIKHSKSAEIYTVFANEFGISNKYDLKLASQENFEEIVFNFFKFGGLGANITTPFKERAVLLCHELTKRAKIANSVNTIKKNGDILLGDNTDGLGFIYDLKRLNWMNEKDVINEKKQSMITNVLLIGAGGAAKGIIPMLLNIGGYHIDIVNRTFSRAQILVDYYRTNGYTNISCVPVLRLFNKPIKEYNLIINATTSSMNNDTPNIPSKLITAITKCYDLFYQNQKTSFVQWCEKNGSNYCADGLGMLVGQAAYSFYLWHNMFPSVIAALNHLRKIL